MLESGSIHGRLPNTTLVAPLNITAAALVTQFALVLIIVLGTALWRPTFSWDRDRLFWPIVPAVVAFLPLFFSAEYTSTWQPVWGNAAVPSVRFSRGISTMFTLDLISSAFLVARTGGSRNSPFTAIYLVLPSLAIFLRQGFWVLSVFTLVIVFLFFFQLAYVDDRKKDSFSGGGTGLAFFVVSALCLLLTTVIGYVTRPQ